MKIIGEGGNWLVYENPQNRREIIKLPKNDSFFRSKIANNINNFNLIKEFAETVKYLVRYTLELENESTEVLITENLNCDEWTFVSPNSFTTDSQKLVRKLNPYSKIDISESIEEQNLGKFKIHTVENIDVFFESIRLMLKIATQRNIVIEFDAYFFGVKRNAKSSPIVYKIADFDNVFNDRKSSFRENLDEFNRAFSQFINHFIEEKQQGQYWTKLEMEVTSY